MVDKKRSCFGTLGTLIQIISECIIKVACHLSETYKLDNNF